MLAVTMPRPAFRLPDGVRQHWLTSLVLAVMAALYLVAGLSVTGLGSTDGRAIASPTDKLTLPELRKIKQGITTNAAAELKPIAPEDALSVNAAMPFSALPNPAARPFAMRAETPFDRLRALDCLTAAVYYESATEPLDGQRAVAQVVLNRVRHPAYPATVCGVVFEGWQRSTGCQFTFTCDGALTRVPVAALWERARQVAEQALAGKVYAPVGHSTHYHTNWVVPYWASSLEKVANVGTHIFYRWSNGWGRPAVFRGRHPGVEPEIAGMRNLSSVPMSAEALTPEEAAVVEGVTEAGLPLAEGALPPKPEGKVERRYEPLRQEAAAAMLAEQIRAGTDAPSTHKWALTGEVTTSAAPAKKAPAATPAPSEKCGKQPKFGPPIAAVPGC